MKFFLSVFDDTLNRPYTKFLFNIFVLKNNFYFNFKNIIYIHFFTNIQKVRNQKNKYSQNIGKQKQK